MSFAHSSTALTDLGLAVEASLFCGLLVFSRERSVQCWAIAFGCTAIAAISGAIFHGFSSSLPVKIAMLCQLVIAYGINAASGLMLLGIIKSDVLPSVQFWWVGIVGIKLIVFSGLQSRHLDDFSYVAADYLLAMIVILLLETRKYFTQKTPSTIWFTGGIMISMVAVCILALRWSPSVMISPDAIYHIVQMVALYWFYRGTQLLADRKSARS
ncbi:MAG: hypothetical protein WBA57_01870 [Elainellaceae cyanobacterium]